MAHTHEQTTAAIVLTALMAIGCSDEKKPAAAARTAPAPVSFDSGRAAEVAVATTSPPAPGPASFGDGEAAYHAGNYVEASRVFAEYVESRPQNAWGHYMLGLSAWKGGDLARAEAAFEQALGIDPNHVKSLVNLGRVLLDQQRSEEALVKLTRAADIDPESAAVYRLLGRAHHAQRQSEDAVAAYSRAIELDAADSWAMNNLGLLFLEEGRPAEAVPLLTQAIEIRKDVPAFHNNLGMALEHTGQFSAAAQAYSAALVADPGYEKAKRNLARVEGLADKTAGTIDAAAQGEGKKDEEPKQEETQKETPPASDEDAG